MRKEWKQQAASADQQAALPDRAADPEKTRDKDREGKSAAADKVIRGVLREAPRDWETVLMAASRKIGVDRDMLQNAVKVLQNAKRIEAKIHRYY